VPPGSAPLRAGLNARKNETVQTAIDRIAIDVQRLRELVA